MRVSTWTVGFWVLSLYVGDAGDRFCVKCEPGEFCTLPKKLAREFFSSRREDAIRQSQEYREAVLSAFHAHAAK